MSGSRDHVLAAIRGALKRGPLAAHRTAELERRLAAHRAGVVPARGRPDRAARVERFVAEAQRVDATTARVWGLAEVPGVVAGWLAEGNLPTTLKVAPDPALEDIPWAEQPLLRVARGPAGDSDSVSVTGALAGVAETGTLVLLSGPDSPTTLNFLPDTHIVVLPAARIVGAYEDAWKMLRDGGDMPRAVNWITGPSRTADIEQTMQLGAHGPRRLHIVVVGEDGDSMD